MKKIPLILTLGILLSTMTSPALAKKNISASTFFDAAFCKPPYSTAYAMDLYNAAEKLGKADKSSGAAVYHLSAPIKKNGFVAQDIVFIGSTVGILIEGNVAEKMAKQYHLAREEINITGMTGYTRQLPDSQQGLKDAGLVYLVALMSGEFKNKTLIGCQFVSNEDRKNIDSLNTN